MKIIEEEQLDFDDVLIQPKRSTLNSRSEVDVFRTFSRLSNHNYDITCIPVMAANMGICGIPSVAKMLVKNGMMCAMEKHLSYEDLSNLYLDVESMESSDCVPQHTYSNRIALSIGTKEPLDIIHKVNDRHQVAIINIDIANGYAPQLLERVKQVRKEFPDAWIIAGTIVTGDITQDLLMAGADIIRANIGAGSVCITRLKTGVGRPALSTIVECSDAAHQLNKYIMSDGGCKTPGDICKALCAGADFIMTGSLFAGTDEAAGDIVEKNGKKFKPYYGMSSNLAQEKHFGGIKKYRTSEGREVLIPYKGPIQYVIDDILGGIRSCCTYIGSRCIKHMSKHATFYKVRHQLNMQFASCENI